MKPTPIEIAREICRCDFCCLTDGMNEGDPEYVPIPCRRDAIASALSTAAQEAAPKWISVKERLPDDDKGYVVYTGNGFVESNFHRWETRWKACGVTHWMPLPTPPQDQE